MKSMVNRWIAHYRTALVCMAALLMVACGGGGTVPWPGVDVRALDPDFTSRMAVAYSPYRNATSEAGLAAELAAIPVSQIRSDLEKLRDAGFGMIRVFDAKVADKAVAAIQQSPALDMKVMMGVWIASTIGKNASTNQANAALNDEEIRLAVQLANDHPSVIKAISVGNETLVSWNTWNPQSSENMATYLRQIRGQVDQPVTTDDNWAFFAAQRNEKDPHLVFNEIDFISMHTYPAEDIKYGLWDWKQTSTTAGPQRAVAMMDAALGKAKADYNAIRDHLDRYGYGRLPVIVGETGWKATPTGGESLWASPVNQKMYFDRLNAWKRESNGPKTIVYFSAFDEKWKSSDDGWGLFDEARTARCTILALSTTTNSQCSEANAKYYAEPFSQGLVSTSRYTVYAEERYSDETLITNLTYGPWIGGAGQSVPGQNSGDGTEAWQVTPSPAEWGWGLAWTLGSQEIDLSQFANGRLNFKIKTAYPGSIEVGFKTGADGEFNGWDVLMVLSPGQFGYSNDGTSWSSVSIPITELVKHGAKSFGSNSPPAMLELNRVSNVFIIADRYEKTRKPTRSNDTTPVLIDDIHWSR